MKSTAVVPKYAIARVAFRAKRRCGAGRGGEIEGTSLNFTASSAVYVIIHTLRVWIIPLKAIGILILYDDKGMFDALKL